MASQRPRRNASPATSKPQPMRATRPFSQFIRNPSPTRGNGIRRPSPSSSPVFVGENAFKPRRNSQETRGSPEHRRSPASSPSLASKGERSKSSKSPSVAAIRRTSSLDAIYEPYFNGQWPAREAGPTVCHKATQTDENDLDESSKGRAKRSNSWGSADHLKELKQRIPRTNKLGNKSSQTYGRQSPVRGVHSASHHTQTQTRLVQSSAIPIPTVSQPSEGPKRMSLEGPNSEIQTLVSSPDEAQVMDHPPDGHRAPLPDIHSDSGGRFRSVDTQTPPDKAEVLDSGGFKNSSISRSQSVSPSYPIILGSSDSRPSSRCSSGGAGGENVSPELPVGSKFSSSPKPNKSYQFAREPPDGAEKVPLQDNDEERLPFAQTVGPDKSRVNFIPSNLSAFNVLLPLPSYPKVAVKSPVINTGQLPSVEATQ